MGTVIAFHQLFLFFISYEFMIYTDYLAGNMGNIV